MAPSPSSQPPPVRRGVTLLELLVVLVLMGIAAAVVAPALRPPAASRGGTSAGAGRTPTSAEELVADARRTAIRRGEPLRLRVAPDGVWALVTFRDGTLLSGGRLDQSAQSRLLDLRIDAMGSCTPAGALNLGLNAEGRDFDPLACRAGATP